MDNQQLFYRLNEKQQLVIKAYGKLEITGWEKPDVAFDFNKYSQKVIPSEDELKLICFDACQLFVPTHSRLQIEKSSDKVIINHFYGALRIQKLDSSLQASNCSALSAEKINGECTLDNILGDVTIDRLNGRFRANRILGNLSLGRSNGNVKASNIGGDINVNSNGNVELGLLKNTQLSAMAKANGNIALHLTKGFTASYTLRASGEDIVFNLAGVQNRISGGRFEMKDTASDNQVVLQSDGKLKLDDDSFLVELDAQPEEVSLHDLGKGFSALMHLRSRELVSEVKEEVSNNLPKEIFESGKWLGKTTQIQPRQDMEKAPVTPAETMLVLQLVQDGKITAAQADDLLSVLQRVTS